MGTTAKGQPNGLATLDDTGKIPAGQLTGGGEAAVWDDITGKPTSFPTSSADISDATSIGVDVLTAANAGAARTAIGAGTSSLAIGTTASTAAAGNHTHSGLSADAAAGTASIRTLGTGATQAAAGNHTHTGLMTGSAPSVADSTATDAAGAVDDLNALLAALRNRGVIS
ncbi:head fiber protein [Actinomadura sp. LOL_016]|uniref:head fiber protein n=1 Tax=unclassified Actinomadura TaxID=2626254 RepID=UPI003A80E83A